MIIHDTVPEVELTGEGDGEGSGFGSGSGTGTGYGDGWTAFFKIQQQQGETK